jgi:hypothetical protein
MLRLILLVAAVAVVGYASLWFVAGPTTLAWDGTPTVVGPGTVVAVKATTPFGVARVRSQIEQSGKRCQLPEHFTGVGRWSFFRRKASTDSFRLNAPANDCPELVDGPATLAVEVSNADPRGRTDSVSAPVRVSKKAASLRTPPETHYTVHTGPSVVKFTVDGDWVSAGVRVGKYRFRPFPMPGTEGGPGRETQLVSFFTVPWDADPEEPVQVWLRASDGRELTANLRMVIERRAFRERSIKLAAKSLKRMVGDVMGGNDKSDPVVQFKKINCEIRAANNRRLYEAARQTAPKLLWTGAFLQLPKSAVQGQFADTRIYMFEGEQVDRQIHLGIDLASTRNAEVPAANAGRVVLAERLGIYGNCVMIDHGLGVQTVYAHLSRIDVQLGADVHAGQSIGRTGMTGLAGGDHLHFVMLIDGVESSPVRLLERNWIASNISPVIPVPGLEKAPPKEPRGKRGRRR